MKVKLNLYINVNDINEDTAIDKAVKMVGALDTINEDTVGEELVTKLYYVVPKLGKIFVVVNDADKKTLGVESNVLANTNISDYPLEKLPPQMVAYKELIIKKGSNLSSDDILNAAQALLSKMPTDLVSVVKVINYNDNLPSKLVMPSIYGDHIFKSVSGIDNSGDAKAGQNIINSVNGLTSGINDIFGDGSAVATYPFDGNGKDLGGKYDGIVCKDAAYVDGKFGKAIRCDSDSHQIEFFSVDPDNGEPSKEFAVSMWFKPEGVNRSNRLNLTSFAGSYKFDDESTRDYWGLYYWRSNVHKFSLSFHTVYTDMDYSVDFPVELDPTKFYFVTFSYKANTPNGCVITLKSEDGTVNKTITHDTQDKAYHTGCTLASRYDYTGATVVDQVRLFNRALTAKEIEKLYNEK